MIILLQVRADPLVLDVIGSGEDLAAIQAAARPPANSPKLTD